MSVTTCRAIWIAAVTIVLSGCAGNSIFGPIGNAISNPLTVAVDNTNQLAYVVNSNNAYQYDSASLHAVNLADVTAPVRVGDPVTIPSFSGEVVLDSPNNALFVTNRLSSDLADTTDALLKLDLSVAPITSVSVDTLSNPFGMALYESNTKLAATSHSDVLHIFGSLDGTPAILNNVTLTGTLSGSEGILSRAEILYVKVVGTQAFLVRALGGLLVVNLNEVGVAGANPVDYYVKNIVSPRGIAVSADSSTLYVLDVDGTSRVLRSILLSTMPALEGGADVAEITVKTATEVKGGDPVAVGINPQQVVVSGTTAYVTNFDDDTVSVVDLGGVATTTTITVGDQPFGMAFYQQDGLTDTHLLVCNSGSGSNSLSIIDLSTNGIVGTYQ